MDDAEVEKAVVAYLKKKGFKQTELSFLDDQHKHHKSTPSTTTNANNGSTKNSSSNSNSIPDTEITRQNLSFSAELESVPAQYHEEYSRLRSWAYGSLDLYKHELLRVLYPLFIHCFMDLVVKGHIQEARVFLNSFREDHEMTHSRDLQKLEGVLAPSHLTEMEFAHSLRQSKAKIKICQYSYELLVQYLQKTESIIMLELLNEHVDFQVSPGQPSSISDDAEAVTLVSSGQEADDLINQKEIHWGLLEDSFEERLEKAGGVVQDSEKVDGENREGEIEENRKRPFDGGKQGVPQKKSKKDKGNNATAKSSRIENSIVPVAPRVKPELTLPSLSVEVELSILEDLRNRVQLSSTSLPSVTFHTFINTNNGLNCVSISHDGSLVAGGFSDSSLKVWNMTKIGQDDSNATANLEVGNDSNSNDYVSSLQIGKRKCYTLFQGHSGPIYSTAFCPVGDFILSSSADSTIRLWSTNLNANLVCYKSHNYPVWDVQFSPKGHFFASSSHDRTARIWSMDRIHPLRIMAGHLSDVDCVQWHPNCSYIATGSSDKTVRFWDVQTGECVRIFLGHRSMVLSLAMSPDGRYMASGDEDGTIMMWDLASGRCVTPLVGHSSCVWTLAFSGDGSLLASGSADCTVKLWDVSANTKVLRTEDRTGAVNRLRSLKTLPTKSSPVYALQFSRKNLLFAAGVLSRSVTNIV